MLNSFLLSFTAVFVALDILGAIPMYLSMTREMTREERSKVVDTSMMVAFAVAAVFIFIGHSLFVHLGIEVYDFRIAGGIILLLISLADLLGNPEVEKRSSGSTGIVPLAVPLISGPGVLTTLLLQVSVQGYWLTLLILVINYGIAWVVLRRCDRIQHFMGRDGSTVLSKIAALLLAAISVAMIRNGVFEAIRAF